MIYRVIGLMSGSSLDGLDIAFVELHENGGNWTYKLVAADCLPYSPEWIEKLKTATSLPALDYQLLHTAYGHYLGTQINAFINKHSLHYQVALIASHGHTTFHMPERMMTAQLGDGAAIAAETQLPVVTDLRNMDIAFGGQGAPIVPIGEKLLLGDYQYFLNLGGIANISFNKPSYQAFDICPANRVLNMLAQLEGMEYDRGGARAATGAVDEVLLKRLNALDFYAQPHPKSLANNWGTDVVFPIVMEAGLAVPDALATYCTHIAKQVAAALYGGGPVPENARMLVTGGGAFNDFLVELLQAQLSNVEVVVPDAQVVNYKEALIMALIGVLRWREEYNVLASVTGASRSSIGGALWLGTEA